MTFADWFESDGRPAVAASGLGPHGVSVRTLCQRAYSAGADAGREGSAAESAARDVWVAHFYLLGLFPAGSALVYGGTGGAAWLDARMHVRRFFRPLIGIEVRRDGQT